MASVHSYATKKSTRYYVSYRDSETRKQTKERGFTRKRDAQEFAQEVETAKRSGTFIRPSDGRGTIGKLGPEWFDRRSGHVKPSTLRPERSAWKVHVAPRWGDVRIGDIRRTSVQAWVTDMTKGKSGPTTVIRAHGILAAILDDAVSDRRLRENPARGVKLPRKVSKERAYLTHQHVAALAASAGRIDAQYGVLVYVLAYCGLRWGEATGLRVKHVNFLRRRLSVEENAVQVGPDVEVGTPKTHERRTVPLTGFLVDILTEHVKGRAPGDLLFTSPRDAGGYLKWSQSVKAGLWWERACRDAGIERVTPHELRHTAASLAVSSGANVKAVQRMLGHASAVMTLDTYADLFDDDLDGVAERMDAARRAVVVG